MRYFNICASYIGLWLLVTGLEKAFLLRWYLFVTKWMSGLSFGDLFLYNFGVATALTILFMLLTLSVQLTVQKVTKSG